MPATRTASSSHKGQSKPKTRQPQPTATDAAPGVQKIKSSLRQTRRLLAKDNLAADVRVETERRLKSLQADLETAEVVNKERAVAVRYHKIKFFERQKVLRKITQSKRQLEKSPDAQSQLYELRVDLNYILHYPRTKKYISLFPPEVRSAEPEVVVSAQAKEKTDAARKEVRAAIREQMTSGELNDEPELHMMDDEPKRKPPTSKPNSKKAGAAQKSAQDVPEIQEDGFFGSDDE